MTDLRAILPAVLAYAEMFNTRIYAMFVLRASGQGFFVAKDAPHRDWRRAIHLAFGRPVSELFGTFLEKKNKVRAASSQIHQKRLTLLQLRYL
jgi:hypothetical protein